MFEMTVSDLKHPVLINIINPLIYKNLPGTLPSKTYIFGDIAKI